MRDPSSPGQQQTQNRGGAGKIITVIVVVIIVVLALLLIAFNGGDDDNDADENGDGDKSNDKDAIKYITAMGGKSQADAAAAAWNDSAKLQHVRGFEGSPYRIDRDEWDWVSDYGVPTGKDESIGDGRCMVWEYEYFPEAGDLFDHFHVLVFGNGTVISWEEYLSGSVNNQTLEEWDLDSIDVAGMAKTLSLYNNITTKDSVEKYVYYELRPYFWELNCDDGTDYIRIQVDEQSEEIIYHYP